MTPSQQINDFANYIALAAFVPFFLATLIYGTRAPWYRSLLGVSMFGLWSSITLLIGFIITRRFWGDYWGYEWVAVCLYTYFFLVGLAILSTLIYELRRGGVLIIPIIRNKENP